MLEVIAIVLVGVLSPGLQVKAAKSSKPAGDSVKVVALGKVPETTAYNWQVPPNHAVACFAAQCDHYYMPDQDSEATDDVILRLLLPDARIIIVRCDAKEVLGANYAIEFWKGDGVDVPIRRVCRAPEPGAQLTAIFDGTNARLLVESKSQDNLATVLPEVYHIKGTLTPIPGNAIGPATAPPADGMVKAFVSTIPFGAQVYLDGERVGTSPLQLSIPATGGVHVFTIRKDGFRTLGMDVDPDSERTRYDFRLQPDR